MLCPVLRLARTLQNGADLGSITGDYEKGVCRPPIEMSPLSPFQMSLSAPGGCWERVTDDGDCDEPHGDRPDARAQGSGGWPDDGERGRAADVADAPPGVPAGQGLP